MTIKIVLIIIKLMQFRSLLRWYRVIYGGLVSALTDFRHWQGHLNVINTDLYFLYDSNRPYQIACGQIPSDQSSGFNGIIRITPRLNL